MGGGGVGGGAARVLECVISRVRWYMSPLSTCHPTARLRTALPRADEQVSAPNLTLSTHSQTEKVTGKAVEDNELEPYPMAMRVIDGVKLNIDQVCVCA